MRKILTVFLVMFLVGCSNTTHMATMPIVTPSVHIPTLIPTPTATLTMTPMLTLTPTPTPIPTPIQTSTPTITPTPVFPSEENFVGEVENNCAPPPDWEADYNLYFEGQVIETGLEFAQLNTAAQILDMMGFDSKNYRNHIVYVFPDSPPYCVAIVISPELKVENNQEFSEFWDKSNWGRWEAPVMLIYWSEKGPVVYKYEPTTMPMPAP